MSNLDIQYLYATLEIHNAGPKIKIVAALIAMFGGVSGLRRLFRRPVTI
jgi:hypothetical protein